MTDAQLECLDFLDDDQNPHVLSPKFKSNIDQYSMLLPSSKPSIKLDCFTFNEGSSYKFFVDGKIMADSREKITFKPDETKKLEIKVESANGSEKFTYRIECKCLSSSSSILMDLAFQTKKAKLFTRNALQLDQPFSPSTTVYKAVLPTFLLETVILRLKKADPDTEITKSDGDEICLNLFQTTVDINVTSPDKSTNTVYKIVIERPQPEFYIAPDNQKPCSITMSLPFPAVEIDGKYYHRQFLEIMTRLNRKIPLKNENLPETWFTPADKEIDSLNGAFQSFSDFINSVKNPEDIKKAVTIENPTDLSLPDFITSHFKDDSWIQKLARAANPSCTLSSLENSTLEEKISIAAHLKNYSLLGDFLLEKHQKFVSTPLQNKASSRQVEGMKTKMAGWDEDIRSICELHGFPKNPTLEQQLQALDKELQTLKENGGANGKIEECQKYYVYKQNQAVTKKARSGDNSDLENQAFQSYFLALKNSTEVGVDQLFKAGYAAFCIKEHAGAEYFFKQCLAKQETHFLSQVYLVLIEKHHVTGLDVKKMAESLVHRFTAVKQAQTFGTEAEDEVPGNFYLDILDIFDISSHGQKLFYLWQYLSTLPTTAPLYQTVIWKILEASKTMRHTQEFLEYLTQTLKFTDEARVSKFLLTNLVEQMKPNFRDNQKLFKAGKYLLTQSNDPDEEEKKSKQLLSQAIVCLKAAIELEGKDSENGPPGVEIWLEKKVEKSAEVAKNVAKKQPAAPSKPVKPAPKKPVAKPQSKPQNVKKPVQPVKKCSKEKVPEVQKSSPSGASNPKVLLARLYLAKCYKKVYENDPTEDNYISACENFETTLKILNDEKEVLLDFAALVSKKDPMKSVDLYCKIENGSLSSEDQAFISGEVVGTLIRLKMLDDARLERHMINWASEFGLGIKSFDYSTVKIKFQNVHFLKFLCLKRQQKY